MKSAINLLSHDDFSSTSLGKLSDWALSIGRWIVIVTELIVIAAFLVRFRLDRDIANLTEDLNQKNAVVNAYAQIEENFRQTQTRLQTISQAVNIQTDHQSILNEIGRSIPNDITLTQLAVEDTQLMIKALALTESGMAGMQQQLQFSPLFSNVSLTRVDIDNGFETGILFEIKAQINK